MVRTHSRRVQVTGEIEGPHFGGQAPCGMIAGAAAAARPPARRPLGSPVASFLRQSIVSTSDCGLARPGTPAVVLRSVDNTVQRVQPGRTAP